MSTLRGSTVAVKDMDGILFGISSASFTAAYFDALCPIGQEVYQSRAWLDRTSYTTGTADEENHLRYSFFLSGTECAQRMAEKHGEWKMQGYLS